MIEQFSWEKPIEIKILRYCNLMATQFEKAANKHRETGWFANNSLSNECKAMAMAYKTVTKYILREMKVRQSINNNKS